MMVCSKRAYEVWIQKELDGTLMLLFRDDVTILVFLSIVFYVLL